MTYRMLAVAVFIFLSFVHCAPGDSSITTDWSKATLVWADEFEGEAIDTTKWLFEEGDHGWGNQEWQDYQPFGSDNAFVEDGKLHIVARLEGEGQNVGDYTSARMNSKQSFSYGRMEIRAKMPEHKGNGIWPAIWMLGDNISEVGWPDCGEIDIMEYISSKPDSTLQTLHTVANNHMNGTQISTEFFELKTIEEEFHNFGILWTEESLKFYVDDPENITLTFDRPENYNQENWPFDKPFYFLMNIAVGGGLGGLKGVDDSIFPATMEVDYVRVWQFE